MMQIEREASVITKTDAPLPPSGAAGDCMELCACRPSLLQLGEINYG